LIAIRVGFPPQVGSSPLIMFEQVEHLAAPNVFADVPPTPAAHFKLYFYAAVLHVIRQVAALSGSVEAALRQFPFLSGYCAELDGRLAGRSSALDECDLWRDALLAWEKTASTYLPLRALREAAGLGHEAILLLMCVGLNEEDPRFGSLFELVQGMSGQHRPTMGLLVAWWRRAEDGGEARRFIRQLQEIGLIQLVNTDAPRMSWALQIPGLLWDAARAETDEVVASWVNYRPLSQLRAGDELVVSDEVRQLLFNTPALLDSGEVRTLIVRGPQHNGRRTLLGALARSLGRGLLEIKGVHQSDDERWRMMGSLATLLNALPIVVLDLSPGETTELPRIAGYDGPLGVVLTQQGGINGPSAERALTISLEMPGIEARRQLWQGSLESDQLDGALDLISERFRITSGNIPLVARLAQSNAALAGRRSLTFADVQKGSRALHRQALDTLATLLKTSGDWSQLAAGRETLDELANLERRCRFRERLQAVLGDNLSAQLNAGVRALLCGPSGTGKTLAARLLASSLQMDLYRLDLSSVVNKYIGETEKNLNQIFARAEELDVILLIDEGDALLTQRTSVQTSNDRYANLETNYLLQRLETYEGIVLVTTNASDRIDSAFQRRMDVIIDFRAPEAAERWIIWQLHLPASHVLPGELMDEVAFRCALTGGQIRNAVLHASLLALSDGGLVTRKHLVAAVQREYRKTGAVCPLRSVVTS
jgi:hypothetical protein